MISDVRLYDPNDPGPVTWAWDQTQTQVNNLKLTGGERLGMGGFGWIEIIDYCAQITIISLEGVDFFGVLSHFALYSLHAILYSLF